MLFAILLLAQAGAESNGLKAPPGFQVTEFADSLLAPDIIRMTLDPRGRIIVSGRGYIKALVDDNEDGRADRAIELLPGPKEGAHGLLWEGDTLYYIGDGGLRRQRLRDDRPIEPSVLLRAFRTGSEHQAHEIRRGPDSWLYLIGGDQTGIDSRFALTPISPIRSPIGGCVVRFSPDFAQSEIVADGFRNPYGMDFNQEGDLFTFDSDNERCVSLPWYEHTRLYHVIPGTHHGWLSPQVAATFRLPPYMPDVNPPLAYLGRGSPTGVACYKHTQFPKKYRGGLFLLDWTFGKVWFASLVRQGSQYTSQVEPFLEATGDSGFAPTDVLVHPVTGDLYVSIGGRGTRGAVYRIRYASPLSPPAKVLAPTHPEYLARKYGPGAKAVPQLEALLQGIADIASPTRERLASLRGLQIALGDIGAPSARGTVWEGYSPRTPPGTRMAADQIQAALRTVRTMPGLRDPELAREWSRTLAILEDPDPAALDAVANRLTPDSDPIDDIHYLIVASRLQANRPPGVTQRISETLLNLDQKISSRKLNRDRNWPDRVGEMARSLARKDPLLPGALLASRSYGRPDHALFARLPGMDRKRAAQALLKRATEDAAYEWNASVVELMSDVPPEQAFPILRQQWDRSGLQEVIVGVLAGQPQEVDRERFTHGLQSSRLETIEACLRALDSLPVANNPNQILIAIEALKRLPDGKEAASLREHLARHLRRMSGQHALPADARSWVNWFSMAQPELARQFTYTDGVDIVKWKDRLARLDWSQGDSERGRAAFAKASCATCHSGWLAVGPDLAGITGRFSRDDVFTAILQPSRDVSLRYRTLFVSTEDGKVYQGIPVYEAVDSMILQTGPASTTRIDTSQIAERRITDRSLMPAGLIDGFSDREIADLYAYLRILKK